MISAIFPLLVHRLLTSGPLDRLSSSSGGIHKRSLGFSSVVEPTYVWSRGKATLETQQSVGKWGVSILGNGLHGCVNSQSAGRSARFLCKQTLCQMRGPALLLGKEPGHPGLRVWLWELNKAPGLVGTDPAGFCLQCTGGMCSPKHPSLCKTSFCHH